LDTSNVTEISSMFSSCPSLTSVPQLDMSKVTNMNQMFLDCYSLTHAKLKNVKLACDLSKATLLTKDSLLYIINNEAAESAITIKLASYAYNKWATDPDIVAALANHPNISLAK
jgi:surface protein